MSSDEVLKQVQAIIFAPHRRAKVQCDFFHFGPGTDPALIRKGLAAFADSLTTGYSEYELSNRFRACKKQGRSDCRSLLSPLRCLYLSYAACARILPDKLEQFKDHRAFTLGMSDFRIRGMLQDPDEGWQSDTWQAFNWKSNRKVDLMILSAANTETELSEISTESRAFFEQGYGATFLFSERGFRMTLEGTNYPIEPFGFRDGLSRIPFWTKNRRHLRRKIRKLVLDEQLGSYLVFRKLEQDVSGFEKRVGELTDQIFPPGSYPAQDYPKKRAYVEAQMVGRFKDGTPLALFDQPVLENGKATRAQKQQIRKFNKYKLVDDDVIDYRADQQGLRCPFHAHVRKANPRDRELIRKKEEKYLLNGKEVEFDIRIARRGIPYRETDRSGNIKTGLLFMCYQASIDSQFMIIQREWCNSIRFPAPTAGADPLIGRKKNFGPNSEYRWIQDPGRKITGPMSLNFQDLISFRGGEFFYVPSITWLKKL